MFYKVTMSQGDYEQAQFEYEAHARLFALGLSKVNKGTVYEVRYITLNNDFITAYENGEESGS